MTQGIVPAAVADPPSNPTSTAKVTLGRQLFWDPVLSGNRDVACATCHHPDFAYSDGRATSIGVAGKGLGPARVLSATDPHQTKRNSQTVLNTAFNGLTRAGGPPNPVSAPMFWDNRMVSLENQLRAHGCEVISVADGFDVNGPAAEIVLAVLSWAAKTERLAINERISAARERVEAEGSKWGRPSRFTFADMAKLEAMRAAGRTIREIAVALKVPKSTVQRALSIESKRACRTGSPSPPPLVSVAGWLLNRLVWPSRALSGECTLVSILDFDDALELTIFAEFHSARA